MPKQDFRNWFAAAFLALVPAIPSAAALPVIADRSEGEVTRDLGAAIEGIAAGSTVAAGTRVRTGADGRAEFSFRGAPTLKLGSRADLLLHSADKNVLRAKLHGGAVSVDTTAGKGSGARDLRLNAGEMRLRVNAARGWVETSAQGTQVCLLSGVIEAQVGDQPARLDTPGQCLRQSGATSLWTMVPEAVIAERVALTQASAVAVVAAAPKPEPAIVVVVAEPKVEEAKPAPVLAPQVEAKPEPKFEPSPEVVAAEPPKAAPAKPAEPEVAAVVIAPPVTPEPEPKPEPKPVLPPVVAVPDPIAPALASASISLPETVAVLEIPVLEISLPPPVIEVVEVPVPAPEPESLAPPTEAVKLAVAAPVAQPVIEAPAEVAPAPDPVIELVTAPTAPSVEAVAPAPAPAPEPESLAPATEAVKLAVAAPVAQPVVAEVAAPEAAPEIAEVVASVVILVPDPVAAPTQDPTQTLDVAVAAPAVEAAPAEPAAEVVVDDGRRWSVVLASFPLKETADVEAARLKTMGLSAEAREYRVGDRHGFRVGHGSYNTREEADAALNKLIGRDPELVGWLAKY